MKLFVQCSLLSLLVSQICLSAPLEKCNLNKCFNLPGDGSKEVPKENVQMNITVRRYTARGNTYVYQVKRIWSHCNGHLLEAQSPVCANHLETMSPPPTKLLKELASLNLCHVGETCNLEHRCESPKTSCGAKPIDEKRAHILNNGVNNFHRHSLRWDQGKWTCNQEWSCESTSEKGTCVRCPEPIGAPCTWINSVGNYLEAIYKRDLVKFQGIATDGCEGPELNVTGVCSTLGELWACTSNHFPWLYNKTGNVITISSDFEVIHPKVLHNAPMDINKEIIQSKVSEITAELLEVKKLTHMLRSMIGAVIFPPTVNEVTLQLGDLRFLLLKGISDQIVACPCSSQPVGFDSRASCSLYYNGKGIPQRTVNQLCTSSRPYRLSGLESLWTLNKPRHPFPDSVRHSEDLGVICSSCLPEDSFLVSAFNSCIDFFSGLSTWVKTITILIVGTLCTILVSKIYKMVFN